MSSQKRKRKIPAENPESEDSSTSRRSAQSKRKQEVQQNSEDEQEIPAEDPNNEEDPSTSQSSAESVNQTEIFRSMQQTVFKSLLNGLQLANSELPKLGESYELCLGFPQFNSIMELERQRLLQLISKTLRFQGVRTTLQNATDEEIFDRLVDANDTILERTGNEIDEAKGIRKKESEVILSIVDSRNPTISTSWNKKIFSSLPGAKIGENSPSGLFSPEKNPIRLLGAKNIPRPQLKFLDSIENSNRPFVSKLKFKHNSIPKRKGKISMRIDEKSELEHSGLEFGPNSDFENPKNPYETELQEFIHKINEREFQIVKPQKFLELEEKINPKIISKKSQLIEFCEKLKKINEFSVDLEHHSYRSFQGITCLMQISTRKEDFLIDCLELWNDMHILNDPFTDPKIVKVFHGAEKDIEWLQRDFGIYVVNLFDTGRAMRALNFAKFSLAFLVKNYANVDLKKEFQLADWRIRPLPYEMMKYAVEDTHYLLYCYDHLMNELLAKSNEQQNLVKAVFQQSQQICLNHYEKPLFNENDYKSLLKHDRINLNPRQTICLKNLFAWRDHIARSEDESVHYVLPTHMMLQMAQILPKEMQGILACCNPVPPLVKQELHELHRIIYQAREFVATTNEEKSTEPKPLLIFRKRKLNPLLHCPHDLSHTEEFEENSIPTETARKGISVENGKNGKKTGVSLEFQPKMFGENLKPLIIAKIKTKSNLVTSAGPKKTKRK